MKTGKRTKIIQAARELLLEVGYESMSPRMVLDRSGAGQGSLYHHFSGKKQLARTVLEEFAGELKTDLLVIFEDESLNPIEKLDHYLARPRQGLRGCKLGRLANEAALADPQLRQPLQEFFEFAREKIRKQITLAISQKLLPTDAPEQALADLIIASVQGGYVLSKTLNDGDAVNNATAGARALLKAYSR